MGEDSCQIEIASQNKFEMALSLNGISTLPPMVVRGKKSPLRKGKNDVDPEIENIRK